VSIGIVLVDGQLRRKSSSSIPGARTSDHEPVPATVLYVRLRAESDRGFNAPGGLHMVRSGTGWPDVLVAAIMASLALQGAFTMIRQGRVELQGARRQIAFPAE
jgi:hypothetical protein